MFLAKCSFARTMLELPLLQPPLAAHRRCCALAAMAWGYAIPPQRACRASQASMRCARVAGAYYHCENGSGTHRHRLVRVRFDKLSFLKSSSNRTPNKLKVRWKSEFVFLGDQRVRRTRLKRTRLVWSSQMLVGHLKTCLGGWCQLVGTHYVSSVSKRPILACSWKF